MSIKTFSNWLCRKGHLVAVQKKTLQNAFSNVQRSHLCMACSVQYSVHLFGSTTSCVFWGVVFYGFDKKKKSPFWAITFQLHLDLCVLTWANGKLPQAMLDVPHCCTSTFSIASSRSPLPAVSFCHCLPLWYCTRRACNCYCHGKTYFILNAHSIKVSRRGGWDSGKH